MQSLSETLPPAISTYLEALAIEKEADSLSGCFLENAIVHDMGREYIGLPGIKSWKLESDTRGVRFEAVDFHQHGETFVLHARVTGQAPEGSTLVDYMFSLSSGKISQLTIQPSEPVEAGGHNELDTRGEGIPPDA